MMNIGDYRQLKSKYENCPLCSNETRMVMRMGNVEFFCKCGFRIILDNDIKILLHRWRESDEDYCVMCGCKIKSNHCECDCL